jgi:nitrite reductase/ring-hydroxylating ferredoxin subunit
MRKIIVVIVFILGVSLFFSSCRRNNQVVPYVAIDTYLNLNLPAYINLNGVGCWAYVSGGNNGLIVYRQTQNVFMVYDRYCTYNIEESCGAGAVDSTNIRIACDCDGSQYQLFDGAVIQGPATTNLHQYRSDFDEINNTLHIYN